MTARHPASQMAPPSPGSTSAAGSSQSVFKRGVPCEALNNTGTLSQQTQSAQVFPSSHGLPEARSAYLLVLASSHALCPPVGVQRKEAGALPPRAHCLICSLQGCEPSRGRLKRPRGAITQHLKCHCR